MMMVVIVMAMMIVFTIEIHGEGPNINLLINTTFVDLLNSVEEFIVLVFNGLDGHINRCNHALYTTRHTNTFAIGWE